MPKHWPETIRRHIQKYTSRPIVIRPHPHSRPAVDVPPLSEAMAGAHAVVVWGSNAGTQAIIAGIPTFHGLPSWLMAGAANANLHEIESPALTDRLPTLVRMAWAQWTLSEIATGEPFSRLLRRDQ